MTATTTISETETAAADREEDERIGDRLIDWLLRRKPEDRSTDASRSGLGSRTKSLSWSDAYEIALAPSILAAFAVVKYQHSLHPGKSPFDLIALITFWVLDFIGGVIIITAGLALAIVIYEASIAVYRIIPPPEWLIDHFRQLTPQTPLELLLASLAAFIVIAPSEEILSRGFIQQGMENSLGKWRGLLVSSALFAILYQNLWQGVTAFFIALPLGYFFRRTDYNLATPIVAHAVGNTISFAVWFFVGI